MSISKGKRFLLLGVLLVVIDQIIKIVVKTNMEIGQHIYVIGNWFQILFIENEGMAFGMKFGGAVGKFLLSFFRIGLFAALCWWITSLVRKSVDEGGAQVLLEDGTPKVPTGVLWGLGGKDFLFFAPVFNFADSCVTVGALYLIFFQYKFFARSDEPQKDKKEVRSK